MSVKRKIARQKAWQELPSEARRYGARHTKTDPVAIAKCLMRISHTAKGAGKIDYAHSSQDAARAFQAGYIWDMPLLG